MRLIFENRNGINEAVLQEGLSGAFTKGALILGYLGLQTLAIINPNVTVADMSRADNIFGYMMKSLSDKNLGKNKGNYSTDIEKMVSRANHLNELGTGKITPETIRDVLGPAGELTDEQKKYLVASVYYHELLKRFREELNSFDPNDSNVTARRDFLAKAGRAWKENQKPVEKTSEPEEGKEEEKGEENNG